MMTKNEKKLLNQIKTNTLKLKENGQIPYCLYERILRLNYDSDIQLVTKLKDLSDKYIRVGGYYHRHPEESDKCELELKNIK